MRCISEPFSGPLSHSVRVVYGVRRLRSLWANRNRSVLSCLLPTGAFAIYTFAGAAPIAVADDLSVEQIEFFESKIRPALAAHCYECQSGEATTPKGGLRLDLHETTLAGGDSGPAVIAGKPAESPLLQALR